MEEERVAILSVYELALSLKRTVERNTFGCWVEGEVSSLKRPPSGHVYFCLKDERKDAVVDAVMYKREAMRWARHLQEGARVQLRGRASFYPPRGRLQWIAEVARPSGRGALLEALERLKTKLGAEGLFAQERKRALPTDPRVVGVVTSRSGAAFRDIVTVARRRGPVRIVLSPALVQGDEAARDIVRAIDALEAFGECDVLIVGRGGGSQEDLMAFNDEAVVRRIAACKVPVVSAVGHEVDTSLSDLAADARAATPSQAAELVVPDQQARLESLRRARRQLARAVSAVVAERRLKLNGLQSNLRDPRFLLAEHQQPLDELTQRLAQSARARLAAQSARSSQLSRRLAARHPRAVLARSRAELLPLRERLKALTLRLVERDKTRLSRLARALSALSPLSVLGRGYALVTGPDDGVVRYASQLRPGDSVRVRLARGAFDGKVTQLVESVENPLDLQQESTSGKGST